MIFLCRYDDAIQLYDRILQEDSTNTVSLKDHSKLQWCVVWNGDYIFCFSVEKCVCIIVCVSFSLVL